MIASLLFLYDWLNAKCEAVENKRTPEVWAADQW